VATVFSGSCEQPRSKPSAFPQTSCLVAESRSGAVANWRVLLLKIICVMVFDGLVWRLSDFKAGANFAVTGASNQIPFGFSTRVCHKVSSSFVFSGEAGEVYFFTDHFDAAPIFCEPLLCPGDRCFRINLMGSSVQKQELLISVINDLRAHWSSVGLV